MASRRGRPGRLGQRHRGGLGVLDVDDAPLAAQPLPVQPAVAGRPAVVDVDDPDAAAGEVRLLQVEQADRVARSGRRAPTPRTAGSSPAGAGHGRVGRRVDQRVHHAAERSLELDRRGRRAGTASGSSATSRRSTVTLCRWPRRRRRPTAAARGPPATPATTVPSADSPARELAERDVQVGELGRLRVEHAEPRSRRGRAAPPAGRRRAPRTAARRAARAARRTPPRPGTAPAAARRSARPGRCSTSRSSRWPRTGSCCPATPARARIPAGRP